MQAYKSIKHFQIVIIESLIRICNSGLNSIQLREGGGGGGEEHSDRHCVGIRYIVTFSMASFLVVLSSQSTTIIRFLSPFITSVTRSSPAPYNILQRSGIYDGCKQLNLFNIVIL